MSHFFLFLRLGIVIAWAKQFWHDNCYHLTTATTKSGLLHLCMLSLLVLEVPSFLYAYFTIALRHGVNEVINTILFTLCLFQLISSAIYSMDKVLTLLLTLTSLVTFYPAEGLSCSLFLICKDSFFLNLIRNTQVAHLMQSLALFAIHHFCNYPMNDKINLFYL